MRHAYEKIAGAIDFRINQDFLRRTFRKRTRARRRVDLSDQSDEGSNGFWHSRYQAFIGDLEI
jgi:hypothetical protein